MIIGFGSREHALAWRLAAIDGVDRVCVAPGNAGTRSVAENVPIGLGDTDALLAFAKHENIDLTIVGPTSPLQSGVVDRFRAAGLCILGPTKSASLLETSKAFSKSLMKSAGIPTASWSAFEDSRDACRHLRKQGIESCVVKLDGPGTHGRGVVVCGSQEEAISAVRSFFAKPIPGPGAPRVLIEERLYGSEASFFALTDGRRLVPLMATRDYKRRYDRDEGPNTGGMGAVGPLSEDDLGIAPGKVVEYLERAAHEMRKSGRALNGIIYAGLIATADGVRFLEFNLRFGNPEALVLLPLLDCDLFTVSEACAKGHLHDNSVRFSPGYAAAIMATTQNYVPGEHRDVTLDGASTEGTRAGPHVFHHGTYPLQTTTVASRERVLGVAGTDETLAGALGKVYSRIDQVRFADIHYRRDIGAELLQT